MFEVREITAKLLFRAQLPTLQGVLRLDISSRCFPADTDQPVDVLCARVAIGERFVQMIQGCTVDAHLSATDRIGFETDALPPPPDSSCRLCIMPNPSQFEAFVLYRLNREFGLDKQSLSYHLAIKDLATDCYGWGPTTDAEQEDFVLDSQNGKLFIFCKQHHASVKALEKADEVWRLSIGS